MAALKLEKTYSPVLELKNTEVDLPDAAGAHYVRPARPQAARRSMASGRALLVHDQFSALWNVNSAEMQPTQLPYRYEREPCR